ncbi:myosin heavy chain, cardiac muscle isoform-like isoform X2 [Mugil cephalus]|nr:myosin heavy chain, cardiac muscle isoform-like isoform X2 [Mugil cephalus]
MSKPNYDHINSAEDLKNEFFTLQQYNEFLCRWTHSLQEKNSFLDSENKALKDETENLSDLQRKLKGENKALKNAIKSLQEENTSLSQRKVQVENNSDKTLQLMDEVQKLKERLKHERAVYLAQKKRDLDFQMELKNYVIKINTELIKMREEVENLQDKLYTAATENRHNLATMIKTMGDITNTEKEEEHYKRTHWFFSWFG